MICACLPTYRPLFDKSVRKSSRSLAETADESCIRLKEIDGVPADLESSSNLGIVVETTIESSWDERYRVSMCPIAEDIWNEECYPASRGLSRSHSGRKASPVLTNIWHEKSRPTSIWKTGYDSGNEKE